MGRKPKYYVESDRRNAYLMETLSGEWPEGEEAPELCVDTRPIHQMDRLERKAEQLNENVARLHNKPA